MSLSVRPHRNGYAVFDGDQCLTPVYARPAQAQGRMSQITTLRSKAATKRRRPCMGCGTEFMSQGAHNRMCDRCRQYCASLDNQMVG